MNLLKNYNLNLSKVYDLAEQEIDVTEGYKPYKPSFASKFIKTFFTAVFSFALIAAIVVLILDPFAKPVEFTDPVEELAPPPPILPPMPGYVQIQVIEFEGDSSSAVPQEPETVETPATGQSVTRNTTPDIEALPAITRPKQDGVPENPAVTSTPQAVIRQPVTDPKAAVVPRAEEKPKPKVAVVTPSPTLPPKYSIEVSDITPAEFDILDGIAFDFGTKAAIISESASPVTLWTVYTPSKNSGIIIEGVEVSALRSFNSRGEAIKYAEKLGGDAIIRSEQLTDRRYAVRVCCMEIEDAKSFAQMSSITDKLFRIKREASGGGK